MSINKDLALKFKYTCHFYELYLNQDGKGVGSFGQYFFYNIPVAGALTSLSKFQNDVRLYENNIINYFYKEITKS